MSLEIKTRYKGNQPIYKKNLNSVVVFFQESENRIEVKNGERIIIDVYENGTLIFSGKQDDFFNKLKTI